MMNVGHSIASITKFPTSISISNQINIDNQLNCYSTKPKIKIYIVIEYTKKNDKNLLSNECRNKKMDLIHNLLNS